MATLLLISVVAQSCVFRRVAKAPPSRIRVDATSNPIARGRYIFENLADCDGCHSERDYGRFGGPVVPGGRGKGAVMRPEEGIPGSIVASNITPDPETGLGRWTDGEKIRAIREGIGRDGRVLFPMMPYVNYLRMSDDDARAVVAYMGTLPPVRNRLPRSRMNALVSTFIRSWPRPASSVAAPDRANPLVYGEYLATLASCVNCHSPMRRGRPVSGKLFAGGKSFGIGNTRVWSPNITADIETGIGKYSEQDFLNRFFLYKRYVERGSPPLASERFSPMPWLGLSQLTPEDLRAIFVYLKSQRPVRNYVGAGHARGSVSRN